MLRLIILLVFLLASTSSYTKGTNVFGVGIFDIKQSLFLKDKLTPMPLSSFQSKLSLKNKIGNGLPLCYIRCKNPIYEPLELSRKRVEDFGWPVYDLNAGHDGMISHPHDTINLFYKIFAEQLK